MLQCHRETLTTFPRYRSYPVSHARPQLCRRAPAMIQRFWKSLPFLVGGCTGRRSVTSLVLLAFIVLSLPVLAGAQHACRPDGDVDRNGSVTAADALLAFQQALNLASLSVCQQTIADVSPQPAMPDGNITAADALCIFQRALSLPSCFDSVPPSNQLPVANAGADRSVDAGTMVILSATASDPDGTVVRYAWEQTGGTMVALSGDNSATVMFTSPAVTAEALTFRFTVTDNEGALASDEVSVTIEGVERFTSVSAGSYHTCGIRDTGEGWHVGVTITTANPRRPRARLSLSVPGTNTRAGCVTRAKCSVGAVISLGVNTRISSYPPLARLSRSVPGPGTPAAFVTRAAWNVGVTMTGVSPYHPPARLPR